MTLIKSISGIRGTIGGLSGQGLTPPDVVKYASAYGSWLLQNNHAKSTVVIGRDARTSGPFVNDLVIASLVALGIDCIELGISTTPTVEIAVTELKCQGGIIITASHNPKQWNALKLLNGKGEFISEKDGSDILAIAGTGNFTYCDINQLGTIREYKGSLKAHIDKILKLPYIDKEAIRQKKFKVVVDAVNSSGGLAVPMLLEALNVHEIVCIHCEPDGQFAHNPEPLPENLQDLSEAVTKNKAHLGISVDPDVDRLAFVCEDGEMFGEEYTLVAIADYVLQHHKKGNTVSNLSSTRALREVTETAGGSYAASAVGEVNVVELMKKTFAVIGGEGNGGIILPELHYGRDALVGIALFLSYLAKSTGSVSMLRSKYPDYHISKNKIELTPGLNVDLILEKIRLKYKKHPVNSTDGIKIDFDREWVHLRKSNTEPIIRIYSESGSKVTADNLAKKIILDIKELIKEDQTA